MRIKYFILMLLGFALLVTPASTQENPGDDTITEFDSSPSADALRTKVTEAFDARQQLLRAELADFQKRLAEIEATIAAREKAKNAIIDKRVKQLMSERADAKRDKADEEKLLHDYPPPSLRPPSDDSTPKGATMPILGVQATTNPINAVVPVEVVFDIPGEGVTAFYMNGTVVSWDGVIAVVLRTDLDPMKTLKSARIYLRNGTKVAEGILAKYDHEFGIGLITVADANLEFLEIGNDPIAANRRFMLYRAAVSAGNKGGNVDEVSVEKINREQIDKSGFFTISVPGRAPIFPEDAGAAVVSATGKLQGLVSVYTPKVAMFDAAAPVWVVPADAVAKVLREYEDETRTKTSQTPDDESDTDYLWQRFGVQFKAIPPDALPGQQFRGGLEIVELFVDSPFVRAELRRGDIVVGMDRWETNSPKYARFVLGRPEFQPVANELGKRLKIFFLRGETALATEMTIAPMTNVPPDIAPPTEKRTLGPSSP